MPVERVGQGTRDAGVSARSNKATTPKKSNRGKSALRENPTRSTGPQMGTANKSRKRGRR
jgi:hypothetical protein